MPGVWAAALAALNGRPVIAISGALGPRARLVNGLYILRQTTGPPVFLEYAFREFEGEDRWLFPDEEGVWHIGLRQGNTTDEHITASWARSCEAALGKLPGPSSTWMIAVDGESQQPQELSFSILSDAEALVRESSPFFQLVAGARRFADEPAVVREFMSILESRVWADKSLQDGLIWIGVIELAVELMRRYPMDPWMQRTCGNMIGGAVLFNRSAGLRAGAAGAAEAMCEALQAHAENPEVQQLASAIGCLCDCDVDENRDSCRRAGAIEAVFGAMRNFNSDGNVQFHAWCGFSSLTNNVENASLVLREGINELSVQMMKEHAKSYRVREEIMQVTRLMMAILPESRERLVQAGFLEELVRAMREEPEDQHVQANSTHNIKLLAVDDANRAALRQLGAVELVLAMFRDYSTQHGNGAQWSGDKGKALWAVQGPACEALSVLAAGSTANRAAVAEAGTMDVVSRAMSRDTGNLHLQYAGSSLLAELAQHSVATRKAPLSLADFSGLWVSGITPAIITIEQRGSSLTILAPGADWSPTKVHSEGGELKAEKLLGFRGKLCDGRIDWQGHFQGSPLQFSFYLRGDVASQSAVKAA